MNERTLSYSEQQLVKEAKTTTMVLGLSWNRIVQHFAWSEDGPCFREYRAADHTFSALHWSKITDWAPIAAKKGDWLWVPELGLVQVEMCGEKRACYSQGSFKLTVDPEVLKWGMLIPVCRIPMVKAALLGFYAGKRAAGRETYSLNTTEALKIRNLLDNVLIL